MHRLVYPVVVGERKELLLVVAQAHTLDVAVLMVIMMILEMMTLVVIMMMMFVSSKGSNYLLPEQ